MEVNIEMQGLRPSLNFDNISSMDDKEILKFKDDRGYNLMICVSEAGHIEAVQNLINRKLFEINSEVEGESAISLAVSRGHHQVVLALLKANAKFLQNFQRETASDELRDFLDLSHEMHIKVNEVNEENLEEVKDYLRQNIETNPSVKYFYDSSNCSLIKRALQARRFKIFKLLWDLNLKLSPHENIHDDLQNFTNEEKENFQKLHLAIFENFQNLSHREITQYRDFRGLNALMLAAEFAKIEEAKFCIEKGFFILDAEYKNFSAASLAYDHKNFEILLLLLNAGAEFPPNFDPSKGEHEELKNFIKLSNSIHAHVDSNSCEKIREILQNFSLKYFYDLQNRSLFRHAIESKKFQIYKILIKNRVTIGPDESFNSMLSNLTDKEREELAEIQLKLADPLTSPTVLSLMAHSFVGVDNKNQKRTAAMEAFDFLLKVARAEIVLKIVATQKNFQIVFDFARDSIQFVDPKAELYMSGMFYSNGRIYIAAKKLFDEVGKYEVMGALVHELCHFATFITFNNYAKPYRSNDFVRREEFKRIIESCCEIKDLEKLIRLVYAEYEAAKQAAELIVRPVQIDVHYFGLDQLEGKQKDFKELYDFYDNHCMLEMQKILPQLEAKADKEKKISKLKKFNVGLMILVTLSILLGSLVAFLIYDPPVSWSELNDTQINIVKDSIVNFHGVEVKFGELFSNDSKVFDLLSSEQIKKALKGETKELSRALKETLHHQVFLNWSNMTQKLKEKFLTREVEFQGQKVKIERISKSNVTLKALSVDQVRIFFKESSFKISYAAVQNVKIYIERFFTQEQLVLSEEHYKRAQVHRVQNKFTEFYKNGSINTDNPKVTGFNKIVESLDSSKIFLLSSAAGDGKSTAFQHFSLDLKEKFPQKWIEFVDLKKHIEVFKTEQNVNESLLKFLGEKLLKLFSFELELFKELFASGNVIFLWDGVDEVSPNFLSLMLKLTQNISETKNFQFISTRPLHSKSFEDKFDLKAQKLIPFSELDRFEFLVKTIAIKKFNENGNEIFEELISFFRKPSDRNQNEKVSKYFEPIKKAMVIFDVTGAPSKGMEYEFDAKSDNFLSNPLLVSMISEISCDENFKVENFSFNSYQLYDTFIKKKLKITDKKGEIVQTDRIEGFSSSLNRIWRVHQFFALKILSKNTNFKDFMDKYVKQKNFNYLSIKIKKSLKHLNFEQISRYGILQVNSEEDFDFAHRTFAEYFMAQFFTDFLSLNEKPDLTKDGNKWEIFALFEFFVDEFNFESKSFFNYAASSKIIESDFLTFWNNQKHLNLKLTNNSNELKSLEVIQFSKYFGMEKFDFKLDTLSPKCLFLSDLYEVEKFLDQDVIRSIFNYRTVSNYVPPFECSLERMCFSSELNEEKAKNYVEVAKKVLDKTEFKSLLFKTKKLFDQNLFTTSVAKISCLKLIKSLWEFIKEHSNQEDLKLFLSKGRTQIFIFSLDNQNLEIITFLKNIHKEVFGPLISWSELNETDKDFVKNSIVNFYGFEVEFGQIFSDDPRVFDLLLPEQNKNILKGETDELSRALEETLPLTWSNMSQRLREIFLTCKVNHHGQSVELGKLTKNDKTLGLLSVNEVRQIFYKNCFKKISTAL